MEDDAPSTVSTLLARARSGDDRAATDLMEIVYPEMRALAGAVMRDQRAGHTLQPTALVHEVWMKLVGNLSGVQDRAHFFAVAATSMRHVLADYAKARKREKRGGEAKRVTLFDVAANADTTIDLVAFHDSLEKLEQLSPRQAKVVELRLFGSLTIDEIAAELDVSAGTVKTDWSMARAWLLRELSEG
jgi:RNA polymerase sigma-70 factor (ECF subfamily)